MNSVVFCPDAVVLDVSFEDEALMLCDAVRKHKRKVRSYKWNLFFASYVDVIRLSHAYNKAYLHIGDGDREDNGNYDAIGLVMGS